MGVMRPELVMKSIVPVVMAGVLGIYGLIIAVIISTGSKLLCSACSLSWVVLANSNLWSLPAVPGWLSLTRTVSSAVTQTQEKAYYLFDGYAHLASGLSCGLAGLAAGMAIGIVGDAGVRCDSHSQHSLI